MLTSVVVLLLIRVSCVLFVVRCWWLVVSCRVMFVDYRFPPSLLLVAFSDVSSFCLLFDVCCPLLDLFVAL